MAPNILGDSPRSINGSTWGYCSLSAAAEYLGMSPQSIRNRIKDGELDAIRTSPQGWRKVSIASLRNYCGYDDEEIENENGCKIAVFCRTSHYSQREALKTQKEKLLTEVEKREDIKRQDILCFSENCSAFGEMSNAYKMCEAIQSGKVKKLYLERFNRLGRQVAWTKWVEYICQKNNVEIIALDREEDNPDEKSIMMLELCDYVSTLSNKMAGAIGGKLTRKNLKPETLQRIAELWSQKYNVREIVELLKRENHLYTMHNGQTGHVGYALIWRWISKGKIKLENQEDIYDNRASNTEKEISEFCQVNLIDDVESKVDVGPVYDRWVRWAEVKKLSSLSRVVFGKYMSKRYKRRRVNSCNYVMGVILKKEWLT